MMKTMFRKSLSWILLGCFLFLSGCARIAEIPKEIWGSSTKALEDARPQAVSKIYDCSFTECFDKVLDIAKKETLEAFITERKKELIVLMGIKGSVGTTEVGVFFSEVETGKIKVEVVSLSPKAQETAAKMIFSGIAKSLQKK